MTITLTPRGAVLFHELPPALLAVASSLSPHDAELARRRAAARALRVGSKP